MPEETNRLPVKASSVASSIRAIRQQKRMTLATLANAANLDRGYLSRIERGEKSPSIGTLAKIAEALEVQMGHLFGETTMPDAVTIVRRDELLDFSGGADLPSSQQAILKPSRHRRLSAFLLSPGEEQEVRHNEHPGEEMLYVLEGAIEIVFPDKVVRLHAGDCVLFGGHLRHQVRHVGMENAKAIIVVAQDLPRSPAEIA